MNTNSVNKLALVPVILAAVALTAACQGTVTAGDATPGGEATPPVAEAGTGGGTGEPTPPADKNTPGGTGSTGKTDRTGGLIFLEFGQTHTYDTGLQVSLSQPVEFTPSEYSAGHDGYPHTVKFALTITNGTDEVYPGYSFGASAESGTREGSRVHDTGLGCGNNYNLIPGRTSQTECGFAVDDLDDIVVRVDPDPGSVYEEIRFTL